MRDCLFEIVDIINLLYIDIGSGTLNTSNKKSLPPKSGSVCDLEPYHPGCPQIVNPERYCPVTDDPAFCKTIGDICDADGFVKPEDAYCTK